MVAVEVRSLSRRFGKFVAVDNISLSVQTGEIFGFLGPNGAGKSTTIRMLCGLLQPSAGSAEVAGFDVGRQPDRVKEKIGYMSQRFSLYPDLIVEENLVFYAGIYGVSGSALVNARMRILRVAGLEGKEKTLAGDLAGGWRQRLALGCALIHNPPILFLDEPTAGVDPLSRRIFWDIIGDLSAEGATIFVTTHYMDEAEHCNRIAFINAGVLVALGTPTELKQISRTDSLEGAFVHFSRNGKEMVG